MLPALLAHENLWRSSRIDHEHPYGMRIYAPLKVTGGSSRLFVNLNYFFPMEGEDVELLKALGIHNEYASGAIPDIAEKNLYHPHSWAMAVRVLQNGYWQSIGRAERMGLKAQPVPFHHVFQSATGNDRYALNSPDIWHKLKPANREAVFSLMVFYKPADWRQEGVARRNLRSLNAVEKSFMFGRAQQFFPAPASLHGTLTI